MRVKALIVGAILLAAFVVAGTGDIHDAEQSARLTGEIYASAPQWAVTR